jgi:hypothetical protein
VFAWQNLPVGYLPLKASVVAVRALADPQASDVAVEKKIGVGKDTLRVRREGAPQGNRQTTTE